MRHTLWHSAALIALVATGPAFAAAPSADGAAPKPATAADQPATSGEIVVTALRNSQTLQQTPAAVTVVSGDLLQRQQVYDIRGIQNFSPAARFSANVNSTRIFIRGIGSSLDFYWVPETSAVNVNGVYTPRWATSGSFFDIANVQVLPGPQGVLYGKSAGGGVVVVTNNRPKFTNEASGLFEYGNYNTYHLETVGNAVLSETLAARVGFSLNKRDGYQSFGLQADDSFAVRASLLWKATEQFSAYLWGTHYKQNGKPTAAHYIGQPTGDGPWLIPATDPVTGASNVTGAVQDFQYTIGGAELTYDFGGATLKYLGSYMRQTEVAVVKLVGNDQLKDNAQNQYTHSLQLFGKSPSLDWIVGIDYYLARSRYDTRFGPRQFGQIFSLIRNRSVSGFGQLTYSATPSLRLVGGLRYTRDSLFADGRSNACFAACGGAPIQFDQSWENLDVKGGVEADVADRVMVYGNVQTGYAPGTFNTFTNASGLNKEIQPQRLVAYTAGLKSQFDDGRVTLNLEGFHYRYRKLIIQSFNASIGQQSLFNAPRATIYGLQLMSVFKPTPNDTITANVAYTHGEYGTFVPGPGQRDLDGLQMVNTPEWTAILAYDHRFELNGGAAIDARVSTYLSSSFWGTFDHGAGAFQDGYSRTDASLVYRAPNNSYSIGAWIKNLENRAIKSAIASSGYAAPYDGATGYEPPRTYGVSFGFKF